MPIQKLFHRFQPVSLYIVLTLSVCYFSVQLILSHFTHALTLLMASYHMLCNIFALTGSIITIKHNELYKNDIRKSYLANGDKNSKTISGNIKKDPVTIARNGNNLEQIDTKPKSNVVTVLQCTDEEATLTENRRQEQKTRNTFGWARVEVLTMLIVCITLASLSFSLLVEALQTLIHIDHQDSMHLPIEVMILGFVGLLLHVLTYILIGGYTLHQGHISHVSAACQVDEANSINQVSSQKQLSCNVELQLKAELKHEIDGHLHHTSKKQGASELLRDISSTIFVIVCGIIVYFAQDKEHTAKFIDPVLSIFSCILVVALSYPYMKESCLILLQTIPDTINLDDFEHSLIKKFPQIVTYHDLHIWQLSSNKYIATVHIVFRNPKLYQAIINEVHAHFEEHRIAHITIQPEFHNEQITSSTECLMQCTKPECLNKVCCKDSLSDLREINTNANGINKINITTKYWEKNSKQHTENEKYKIIHNNITINDCDPNNCTQRDVDSNECQMKQNDNMAPKLLTNNTDKNDIKYSTETQKTENPKMNHSQCADDSTIVTNCCNDTKC